MESDFYKKFNDALDYVPFLCLEAGYSRVTDWTLFIYNISGRQKTGWGDPIARFQHPDRKIMFASAFLWMCDWMSENIEEDE